MVNATEMMRPENWVTCSFLEDFSALFCYFLFFYALLCNVRKCALIGTVKSGNETKQNKKLYNKTKDYKNTATQTLFLRPVPPPPMPGKKGVGLTLNTPERVRLNVARIRALKPSWNYSWDSVRIAEQPDDIEFIPMLWGAWGGEDNIRRRIQENVLPAYKLGKVHRLLAFNEPDMKSQSNLDVDSVIQEYWPVLQESGIPLASPSVGHAFGAWMIDFMKQVKASNNTLRVDYTAIHWYKGPNAEKFKQHIIDAYHKYGERPILLTEFAPADWNADANRKNRYTSKQVLAFAKDVLPWLERQPFVAGYAWFSFPPSHVAGGPSALFDGDDSKKLTPLGRYYASVTPAKPDGDQDIEIA